MINNIYGFGERQTDYAEEQTTEQDRAKNNNWTVSLSFNFSPTKTAACMKQVLNREK